MMLRNMQAVEPGLLGSGDEFEPFVVLGRERPVLGTLKMVEKADFHTASPCFC